MPGRRPLWDSTNHLLQPFCISVCFPGEDGGLQSCVELIGIQAMPELPAHCSEPYGRSHPARRAHRCHHWIQVFQGHLFPKGTRAKRQGQPQHAAGKRSTEGLHCGAVHAVVLVPEDGKHSLLSPALLKRPWGCWWGAAPRGITVPSQHREPTAPWGHPEQCGQQGEGGDLQLCSVLGHLTCSTASRWGVLSTGGTWSCWSASREGPQRGSEG